MLLTRLIQGMLVAVTLCCLIGVTSAQSTPIFEGELGAPIYDTAARSGGVNWIAYGDIYPVGTFDQRPACSPPDVRVIGRYVARVEWGGPDFYAVTYRVTFGFGSAARQFVFSGIIEYELDELTGLPLVNVNSAGELIAGAPTGEFQADFRPRSALCLGGSVAITALQ